MSLSLSCCRWGLREDGCGDDGGAGLVFGPVGNHPNPPLRLRHGVAQGTVPAFLCAEFYIHVCMCATHPPPPSGGIPFSTWVGARMKSSVYAHFTHFHVRYRRFLIINSLARRSIFKLHTCGSKKREREKLRPKWKGAAPVRDHEALNFSSWRKRGKYVWGMMAAKKSGND